MALYPSKFNGQDKLQPGARGETFQTNMPGYRDGADRVNRTQNKLNTNAHDVPNIKYEFDRRLPVLFKYGFAYGYNQVVIPKGRIVAADPYMSLVDFDTKKAFNALTLANGGNNVKIISNQSTAGYNKEWEIDEAAITIDDSTGKVTNFPLTKRPANIPIGIMARNEYTRDDDAFNGIMPGAVLTDAMVELPWFLDADKAQANPWGSAHGELLPGDLVKSDANGRFVKSNLSDSTWMSTATVVTYEAERQQVIGQVYSTNKDLVPEGAARFATWALSDRLNFNEFNPDTYRQNNRTGEDAVNNSPYNSEGQYPGYPYDATSTTNDLHMLASTLRKSDNRLGQEYQYENLGIPGLTDGVNAVSRTYAPEILGRVNIAGVGVEYVDMFFKTSEVNLEAASLQLSINDSAYVTATVGAPLTAKYTAITLIGDVVDTQATPFLPEDVAFVDATDAQKLAAQNLYIAAQSTFLTIKYADLLQGIVVLAVSDKAKADTYLAANGNSVTVKAKFNKRGLAGVPTFLDWDGCVGSVKVLLTK